MVFALCLPQGFNILPEVVALPLHSVARRRAHMFTVTHRRHPGRAGHQNAQLHSPTPTSPTHTHTPFLSSRARNCLLDRTRMEGPALKPLLFFLAHPIATVNRNNIYYWLFFIFIHIFIDNLTNVIVKSCGSRRLRRWLIRLNTRVQMIN